MTVPALVTSLLLAGGARGLSSIAPASQTAGRRFAPRALGAEADPFGVGAEEKLLKARREGQDSFDGAISVEEADPFGYADEARTTRQVRERAMEPDPFGFKEEAAMLASLETRPLRARSLALPSSSDRPCWTS